MCQAEKHKPNYKLDSKHLRRKWNVEGEVFFNYVRIFRAEGALIYYNQ
jgi:hypothetical protein